VAHDSLRRRWQSPSGLRGSGGVGFADTG